MITEKHYTNRNEHPEDRIYAVKKFINELSNVQDFYYNQLLLDLNLESEVDDYLFDYIFNEKDEIEFDEFLSRFKKTYTDFTKND
jgi:hypothetical protein